MYKVPGPICVCLRLRSMSPVHVTRASKPMERASKKRECKKELSVTGERSEQMVIRMLAWWISSGPFAELSGCHSFDRNPGISFAAEFLWSQVL